MFDNCFLIATNSQELYFLCDSETPGGVSENRELALDPERLNSTAVSGYNNLHDIFFDSYYIISQRLFNNRPKPF
jgi:hypothetical protein